MYQVKLLKLYQHFHRRRTLPVSHCLEGLEEFVLAESAFFVSVMTFKHSFLLVDEGEESSKLLHINGSCHVGIKHVDHHSTGFLAEHRHVTVCQSLTHSIAG